MERDLKTYPKGMLIEKVKERDALIAKHEKTIQTYKDTNAIFIERLKEARDETAARDEQITSLKGEVETRKSSAVYLLKDRDKERHRANELEKELKAARQSVEWSEKHNSFLQDELGRRGATIVRLENALRNAIAAAGVLADIRKENA